MIKRKSQREIEKEREGGKERGREGEIDKQQIRKEKDRKDRKEEGTDKIKGVKDKK